MMWTYQNKNICLCYIRLEKSEIVVLTFYMTKETTTEPQDGMWRCLTQKRLSL